MSNTSIPAGRGGSLFEVDCLRKGVEPRRATDADFFTVRVRAPNALSARLAVRNEREDVAHAFDARKVAAHG